ncbi:BTAD domain-containing putative transcriptional regulator [Deinococcus radiopugnans]|uniref:Transcriptional regulator n=1 Tax=Deinococcus radiopugnans ATCC 19172 TaxID=585398 RepID=A0A5C4Y611_9DEIO|nr:BTAD domain-containing putative transcriptional regulator [Deinococcus radiopugnans]MBB6016748.1 ATP/maltotriose-dependent transcriptional regulator MalT/DNA-binding SARP family transcriptional activator [Deinococcus radiopugnans ATCC 19172]TNM70851.1 transcriptional regulator [Deinococcus radiopugnans ATCC 19172]
MTLNWRDLTSRRRARVPAVRGALARPRLQAVMDAARVMLLVAPAGYGKTTALAANLAGPHAWLTLDADDADPQVLAAGLALAAESLPGGAAVADLLDAGAAPRRVAARVADLLDACGGLLVLDEAQHLCGEGGGGTSDVLHELLGGGLPGTTAGRLALLSRVPLSLPELARLDAAGEVTRLGTPELAFTRPEVGALLRAGGLQPTDAEVRLAHTVTEGWPIALRFLAQAAAQGRVQLAGLADLDGGEAQLGTLFAYLASEVLGPLTPPQRAVLARGSLFEELTAALAREVLGEPDGAALLEALARGGTFLTRSDHPAGSEEAVYRAHPLLRAHLRGGLSGSEVQILAARGAAYFERTGRPRRALAAHLLSGDVTRAAALLSAHGAGWLAQGRAGLIERSLGRLPRAVWTPELHALAGDALRLSSRYSEALAEYERATPLLRALGGVQVALDTVQPDAAWEALALAEALAPGSSAVRRLRAENLLNAGRLPEALALEPELRDGARAALRSGDLERALALALAAARGEAGGARAAQNHREGLLLAAFVYALRGESGLAAEHARAGLAEGERLESPFVRSLALARLGHARMTAGDLDGARATYEEALALAQPISGRLRVEPLMGLAALAGRAGDAARAAALKTEALAQTGGDGYMAGLLHLAAALGLQEAGDADAPGLEAAFQSFQTCGDAFGLACVALARFAADGQAEAEAAGAAARYPFLLARRGLLSPAADSPRRAQLLARLAQAHPELHSALRPIAHELGYPELPRPDQTPGFCVRVAVLGRVSVTRSHEDRPREWGRARARDLLALLAVHDGGLAREAAQEALFAGADPGVGERNFRVTLHALGQVLEEGAASGVFLERGDWIRLKGGPDLRVDLHAARALLAAPAGEAGRLDGLLALPGRVADSDLGDVQDEAQRYATRLPDALAAEADFALGVGDAENAVRAAERALALDAAHENAAHALMRAWHARGNAAAARRVYEQLRAALDELGLQPLTQTRALGERGREGAVHFGER